MAMRRLACCNRDMKEISIDFDEPQRIMSYNGLEMCIINSQFDNDSGTTSKGGGCVTDSCDEDDSSCSSSTNAFGSFSSPRTMTKKDEWNFPETPRDFNEKDETKCAIQFPETETMKEKFCKLLLGEDLTGGTKGVSTALALSNAITNLAATIFGELWKLEPLSEERKSKWKREMDWLLAPTNYMVELVPAKQNDKNGQSMEIMIPEARPDIKMNLPALQKLDSMLIEMLDSMVGTEFWYAEMGSRAEGKNGGKRWWLPSPQVPTDGLSDSERKRLLHQGKLIYQVFKAAKAINRSILVDMPIPAIIKDALPKSGKESLGEELYKILSAESLAVDEMLNCLNLKSEHAALNAINKLEAAVFCWKGKITVQSSGKSPIRKSWSFVATDPVSELNKTEFLVNQSELLLQQIKAKYPNLPHTFLDVTKIQYGKDVGQSVLEAYSRVLASLAFSILSRIGDILQEDVLSNPDSPMAIASLVGVQIPGISDSPVLDRIRYSLVDQLKNPSFCGSYEKAFGVDEAKISSGSSSPRRSRVWCIGREACRSLSAQNSP